MSTDILVLCYHAVSPTWRAPLSVTEDALERQLGGLLRQGWTGATFTDAILRPVAPRTLVVTFDDGFASVHDRAEPILTALGLRATVFPATAFMTGRQPLRWDGIDRWIDTPDAHELTSMSWDDLGDLADRGWEIGSHTHTHPHLIWLGDAAVRAELEHSQEACAEHLPRPCRSIAYPYGEVDARIEALAGEAGYVAGARLSRSLTRAGPYRWPRVGIYHSDVEWRFGLKTDPLARSVRASRMWGAAGALWPSAGVSSGAPAASPRPRGNSHA